MPRWTIPRPAPAGCYYRGVKTIPRSSSPCRSRGFTLVEMLAVLAVIAAIVAIGLPAISRVLQNGRVRNAEGTATVLKSAIASYLGRPGSLGTLPVTEGTVPASEYVSTGTILAAGNIGPAATLDGVLLAEGLLERPLAPRMGAQNAIPSGVPPLWSPAAGQFTGPATGTLASYAAVSRAECAVSDGASNPGATGQSAGAAACAFNLAGNGVLVPAGSRVAYLLLKSVPTADAYQLAADVDGAGLLQNTAASPAGADQTQGPVAYAKDAAGSGLVDVFYYLTQL